MTTPARGHTFFAAFSLQKFLFIFDPFVFLDCLENFNGDNQPTQFSLCNQHPIYEAISAAA